MPNPVEALPCGSRSMISTRSPIAASAVPRLIAVVVLPTPPFWLAIAITRAGGTTARVSLGNCRISPEFTLSAMASIRWGRPGPGSFSPGAAGKLAHHNDSAGWIRLTDHQFMVNFPIFGGLGQFGLYILTLRQNAFYTNFDERHHVSQQSFHWGKRAGGNDVWREVRAEVFDPQMVDGRRQLELARDVAQERRLLAGALDQMHR